MGKVMDMRGKDQKPETPEGPVAAATPVYMIEAGGEGVRGVTPDYLDERANGGPEQFQVLQMQASDRVIQRTLRGKSVWDSFLETAVAALLETADNFHSGDEVQLASTAAAIADAMIAEKRRRDPQAMRVQLGSDLAS